MVVLEEGVVEKSGGEKEGEVEKEKENECWRYSDVRGRSSDGEEKEKWLVEDSYVGASGELGDRDVGGEKYGGRENDRGMGGGIGEIGVGEDSGVGGKRCSRNGGEDFDGDESGRAAEKIEVEKVKMVEKTIK